MAAATLEVVSSGRSRASTSTRCPACRRRRAQLSPTTPAPTTTIRSGAMTRSLPHRVGSTPVRLVVARCQVDYAGRLTAHLPMATRVLMIKADGSVLVHSDGGSYKPLNWMSPPCTLREGLSDEGAVTWTVTSRAAANGVPDTLQILIEEVFSD